jgi:hypothetical protein
MPPKGGLGGGMPPLPPIGGGGGLGGGLGGGMPPPPMGGAGGDQGQQPVPVKTISAYDVWSILKDAAESMSKDENLSVYNGNRPAKTHQNNSRKSSLMS